MSRTFLPHVITDDSALGGSVIERSVRLNQSDNPYFNRTATVAGDRRTFTLSIWVKFYKTGGNQDFIFMCGDSPSNQLQLSREGVSQINFEPKTGGSTDARFYNKTHLRDHKWYHLVLKIDSTQSTESDRMAFYINGVQDNENTDIVATTYPSQNLEFKWGENGISYVIGRRTHSGYEGSGDMQIADAHYVSGYAYDATAFGYFEDQTGIWKPKKYTGSYGSAGWHLDFSDKTSTTTLGYDKSGNGNHFTANGISVSSGIGNDSLLDTPTNVFPTWSRLSKNNSHTYTEGCQKVTSAANNQSGCVSTFGAPPSGKWYCEYHAQSSYLFAGVTPDTYRGTGNVITPDGTVSYYSSGDKYIGSTSSTYNNQSYGNGDVIGIALDMDGKKVTYYKNNTSQGAIDLVDTTNGHLIVFAVGTGQALTAYINFGQQEFTYTPPTGYKKICSANIVPKDPIIIRPQKHFDVLLYTPNSSSLTVDGLEFTPDLIWLKSRTQAYRHYWFDVVRGTGQKALSSDINDQEGSDAGSITSFNRGGFSIPGATGFNDNGSGTNGVVAWCWKAGGAAVSNSDGTITTSISANQEAGFSIVTYTGTGSAATIGHGLGKAPKVVITKLRDTTTQDWFFMTGEIMNDRGKYQKFNESGSIASDTNVYPATATTSTVYSIGTDSAINGSGSKYVAYCWAEIPGFSRFGKYRGNFDADGSFIHLGFRPAFFIVKKNTDDNWYMGDYKRDPTNPGDHRIFADVNTVEGGTGQEHFDIVSNGIKWRRAKNPFNNSDSDFIYMAWAQQPGITPFDTFPNPR